MDRMTTRRILFSLIAAIAVVGAACASAGGTETPGAITSTEIEIAPTFTVPTADGGEFSLAEHLATDGRPIFLNLWASWCFPCREEMPAIEQSSKDYPGIAFIGVSVQDSRLNAEEFADEIGVTYTIGFDDLDEVDAAYRPLGLPASYFISSDGVILERVFGKLTEEDLAEKFKQHFGQ